ncbi:hypothetical protein ASE69_20830 [Sphingomonas sp. Leaf208]|nr:hypothetical protein ASE69_20830 [Sphingomonas sp. Leaf208]
MSAITFGTLAIGFLCTAHRSGMLTRTFFRWLLVMATQLHLSINTLALQLLFECTKGLVDVVVADGDQHGCWAFVQVRGSLQNALWSKVASAKYECKILWAQTQSSY